MCVMGNFVISHLDNFVTVAPSFLRLYIFPMNPHLRGRVPLSFFSAFLLSCSQIGSDTTLQCVYLAEDLTRKPARTSMATSVDNSRIDASKCLGDISSTYWSISRPCFSDVCPSASFLTQPDRPEGGGGAEEDVWDMIREEAQADIEQEPVLGNYYVSTILSHNSLERALAAHLASKLSGHHLPGNIFLEVFLSFFSGDQEVKGAIREDLKAAKERDPACVSFVHCLLNFKGFLACQAHRVAHKLWTSGRRVMALLIQNRVSEVFAVDIHPGARIGRGILFDHATGVVIGETAVIGDNVSILHNVTLGGTGKVSGDRHPKIGDGVLIGAGTQVLGNVRVGDGAKIGAGSVVLKEVPARTTAVGNPARLVGGKMNPIKLDSIPSFCMDHSSFISEWSDYTI